MPAARSVQLGGFPVPDVGAAVGGWIESQLGALAELKGEAIEQLATFTKDAQLAEDLLGKVDEHCASMLGEAKPVDGDEGLPGIALPQWVSLPVHSGAERRSHTDPRLRPMQRWCPFRGASSGDVDQAPAARIKIFL